MFRLNKYVHIIKNENYIALFHFMNGKIVLFMEAEAIELINTVMETGELESDNAFAKQLIAQDFIVPSDVDEQKLIDYHYNQYVYNSERVEIIMILSELCNFRCEYCYEEYEPTIMSNDIEEGVIHFIQDLIKTYHCKKLTISWFGGEPTLFKDRIIAFMQTVKKKIPDDIILNGYMTTNGYLLDFENFLDYYNVGITGYQITLDGFSHTHDELRKLKSGEATWDTVYKNLKAISDAEPENIDVLLRINYNEQVMEDIFEFIEYAKKEFNNRFTIHAHPISKLGNEDRECICDYAFSEIAEEIIGEYFATSDIRNDFSLLRCQTFGEICYASVPTSYVIDAKGAIRKCTVCLTDEKNKVGEIIDRENFHMNFYALSQWTECKLSLDECSNCVFYPVCVGRLCPNAVLEGNTECRFNKQAVYRHIELVADMLYNKRMLNQPK